MYNWSLITDIWSK